MSLFSALSIGFSGLREQQRAVNVAGHNIANLETPGYSKQRLDFENRQGISRVDVQGLGYGQIVRKVDSYLTNTIRDQSSQLASLQIQNDHASQVEEIINTFNGSDLAGIFNDFFEAAQNLSLNPQDAGVRVAFVSAAEKAAFHFNHLGTQLSNVKEGIDDNLDPLVNEINNLTKQIAELNVHIVQVEEGGPNVFGRNANDARDERDQLLKELAEIVPITVHENSRGVLVSVGGEELIRENGFNEVSVLTETINGEIVKTAVIKNTLAPLTVNGLGELGGTYVARDTLVGGVLTDLNTIATAFMKEVNAIQTTGFGLSGYQSVTSWEAPTATNVPLNSAGFSRSVEHGNITIQVREADGTITPVEIQVDVDGEGFDTTVESLRDEINQKLTAAGFSDISASIDNNNFLTLSSSTSTTFSFTDDSSGVLHALGWGTLLNGKDAQSMSVNSLISNNVNFVAAGATDNPQDNLNALKFVELRDKKVLNGASETLEEGNLSLLSNAGTNAARATSQLSNQSALVENLENERREKVGVNLDEEIIDLTRFQKAYEGSARFIGVIDEMLDRLINGLF